MLDLVAMMQKLIFLLHMCLLKILTLGTCIFKWIHQTMLFQIT